jgi:hypothetical protein
VQKFRGTSFCRVRAVAGSTCRQVVQAHPAGVLRHLREQRLHQLIRQRGPVTERTFEITFLDPGPQAFAFTFG